MTNVWKVLIYLQAEIRIIKGITASSTLLLDLPLSYDHRASGINVPGSAYPLVFSAEVAMLDSNIVITSVDGPTTWNVGGEKFGAYVHVHDNATGIFDNIAMWYCGQAGLKRACMQVEI